MPGGYAQRWKDVWHRGYISGLVGGGSQTNALVETLDNKLQAVEDYYEEIRGYLKLAGKANADPQNATLKKQLATTEAALCSKEMLGPYREAGVVALKGLQSVAELVSTYLKETAPSQSWYQDLTGGLKEVQSISNDLRKDLEAYVPKTLSTLLALKAVGGTGNMPPLPPTPGTTV
jgi:hypothetical protein